MLKSIFAVAACLAASASAYDGMTLAESNITVIAIVDTSYGNHFFCRGAKGFLWHKYPNTTKGVHGTYTAWRPLPNPPKYTFDSDPAIIQNKDGRIELIARNVKFLDLIHWYQKNASVR